MKKLILFPTIALTCVIYVFAFSGESFLYSKGLKKVCITTGFGDIKIQLYDETPQHRDNFIKLAKAAYFDGILFHRVIKNFMIQGGDPDSKTADSTAILGNGGPSYTIPAEILFDSITNNAANGIKKIAVAKYYHKRGAVGAARDNNPAKASSGSQFYIVQGKTFTEQELANFSVKTGKILSKEQIETYKTVGGTPWLDGDYTVFGLVYEGMDVVDKIADVKTSGDPYNRPLKDVKMISVKVIE